MRDNHEFGDEGVGCVEPAVDLEPRDDKSVPGLTWLDRQERNAVLSFQTNRAGSSPRMILVKSVVMGRRSREARPEKSGLAMD
jgi:hypothetical protein